MSVSIRHDILAEVLAVMQVHIDLNPLALLDKVQIALNIVRSRHARRHRKRLVKEGRACIHAFVFDLRHTILALYTITYYEYD